MTRCICLHKESSVYRACVLGTQCSWALSSHERPGATCMNQNGAVAGRITSASRHDVARHKRRHGYTCWSTGRRQVKKYKLYFFSGGRGFVSVSLKESLEISEKSLINCLNPTELRGPELFAGHCCPCLQLQFSSLVSSGLTAAEVLFLGRG